MYQHALHFDAELSTEDINYYEECLGVVGISAYKNTISLYYAHSPTKYHLRSLQAAINKHQEEGVSLEAADPALQTVLV